MSTLNSNEDRLFKAWLCLDEATRLLHDGVVDGLSFTEAAYIVRTVEGALCALRAVELNLAGVPEPKIG